MFEPTLRRWRRNNATDHARISPAPKQVTSGALFDGAQEIRTDHHGQEYRLRETRNGKLILTK
jgi:hemin uptake protein HemP